MTNALPIAQTLLACLCEALADRPEPPGVCCLRGGDHVSPMTSTLTDECCNGLGWVRIVGTSRADAFDSTPTGAGCLNHMRVTTLELGVVRCMPTPGPDALVSCDQWSNVVAQMESDHAGMEEAVCCLVAGSGILGDPDIQVQDYVPRGPDANCIGGTLQITVTYGCTCGSS